MTPPNVLIKSRDSEIFLNPKVASTIFMRLTYLVGNRQICSEKPEGITNTKRNTEYNKTSFTTR